MDLKRGAAYWASSMAGLFLLLAFSVLFDGIEGLRWVGGVFAYSAESRKSALLLGKHLYLNGIGIHLLEKRGLQLG